jgi:hypothetical protein
MATLRSAARLTDELDELTSQLRAELTDGDVDFARLTEFADKLGEQADNLASTFTQMNQILTDRIVGGDGQPESREGRGSSDQDGESTTKEELLERAKEAGVQGRSSMSKEELEEALDEADRLSKQELLDRAKEAGIAGRSSMTKDELKEALRAEEGLSKDDLVARAREAGLPGRSEMSKDQLRDALRPS